MSTFSDAVHKGSATTAEALALFDSLEVVDLDSMLGRWHGAGFPTHHRMDGILEAYGWYGKEFHSANEVDPLLFKKGKKLVRMNPERIPLTLLTANFEPPKSALIGRFFSLLIPMIETKDHKARMRMTEFRGKVSATMMYDGLPINDVFRKVDENTLFGLMDLKGMDQPFFFILYRD
jgi:hypothetical protein